MAPRSIGSLSLWHRMQQPEIEERRKLDDRVDVGVLGATGAVGQRLVQHLEDHPWFRLAEVCGSEASVGKTLAERTGAGADQLSSATQGLELQALDGPWTSSILLSALPSDDGQNRVAESVAMFSDPIVTLVLFSHVVAGSHGNGPWNESA